MFYDFIIKYTDIFVEKMREAFAALSMRSLEALTNDVISFEQPGPLILFI